jgi:hypothetical protein
MFTNERELLATEVVDAFVAARSVELEAHFGRMFIRLASLPVVVRQAVAVEPYPLTSVLATAHPKYVG